MIQATHPSQILTPTFHLNEGDGSGNSLADARVRNANGRCATQGCNNHLDPSIPTRGMLGCLCRNCDEVFEQELQGIC
jgi:hypothetical protein